MLIRRTARALAISRAVLALVFLAAVWLEPTEPARTVWLAYGILIAYFAWSALVAAVAWSNWWWDFRLAWPAQVIDIAVFEAAVFFTETAANDFSSPFLAFSAFLLITASVRWGLRGVITTALVLLGLYGAAGIVFTIGNIWIDPFQFGRRLTYMMALSAMMIWLCAERRMSHVLPLSLPTPDAGALPDKRRRDMMAAALLHARRICHARGAAIVVTRTEEPWVDLFCDIGDLFTAERIGPGGLTDDFGHEGFGQDDFGHDVFGHDLFGHDRFGRGAHAPYDAVLFDTPRRRRIVARPDFRLMAIADGFSYALADACGAADGLLAGFNSVSSHGQVLIFGVSHPSIDDLPVIAALARDIGQAIDREDMAMLAQSIAVSGLRNDLARDLHDSVAQFLAGTLFRLEALRRWIREGNDPDPEILAMKEAFRGEQGQLRMMIDRLRRGVEGDRGADIVAELETLMGEMGAHWHIATTVRCQARPIMVSMGLTHELRLLVREAVANAVRHGACTTIDLHLESRSDGRLRISICDNGKGFLQTPRASRPRSIGERIDALGGRMDIVSSASGVQLDIVVPLPRLH